MASDVIVNMVKAFKSNEVSKGKELLKNYVDEYQKQRVENMKKELNINNI